jgi:hypothetical protein
MDIQLQTSEADLSDDITLQSGQPEDNDEGGDGGEGTSQQIDYKQKFSQSSAEALRLLTESKVKDDEIKRLRAENAMALSSKEKFEKDLSELDPEKFDMVKIREALLETNRTIAGIRQENEISSFLREVPEATNQVQAIKDYMRVYPDKSPVEIWETVFKPIVGNPKARKQKVDTTTSGIVEMETEHSMADFNKMSLEDKAKYLRKMGIKM